MYSEQLDNGISIRVTDHSRQVAGDRWYIKLVCRASMPVDLETMKVHEEDGPELLARIQEAIGKEISKEFALERNFVDDREMAEVAGELLVRIKKNIRVYLASENFPDRLFADCYEETRAACLTLSRHPDAEQSADDDGPADFSACFND